MGKVAGGQPAKPAEAGGSDEDESSETDANAQSNGKSGTARRRKGGRR